MLLIRASRLLVGVRFPHKFCHYSTTNIAPNPGYWDHLSALLHMDVTVNKEGNTATVKLPALNHNDFDRTGKPNIRSIQYLMTVARFFAYHTPNEDTGVSFIEYDKVTADRLTFMASTCSTFDEKLFSLVRRHDKQPSFAVDLQLGYLGTSSLNSVARLYCRDSGHVYAENTNQVVMVDKVTRKPTTIPDWWKAKYENHTMEGGKSLKVPLIPVPDRTHTYDMKVPWTDIDAYKHTNYANYIRYCQDAALDAGFADYFSQVKGDFFDYKVNKMEICYKGESVANDLLKVHVWENKENALKLHFSIEKNGAVIFQCTMTLFAN